MKAQCVECGEILSQPIFCFQIFGHGMFKKKRALSYKKLRTLAVHSQM